MSDSIQWSEAHVSKAYPYEHRDLVFRDVAGRPTGERVDGLPIDPRVSWHVEQGLRNLGIDPNRVLPPAHP